MSRSFLLYATILSLHAAMAQESDTALSHHTAAFASVYAVFSENQQYLAKSVPFDEYGSTGRTSVYHATDTVRSVMSINEYLQPPYFFVSNDGQAVVSVESVVERPARGDWEIVRYYRQGKVMEQYRISELNLSEFFQSDSARYSSVLYNSFGDVPPFSRWSIVNHRNNSLIKGDTLYLLFHGEQVYGISMSTGRIVVKDTFENFIPSKQNGERNLKSFSYAVIVPDYFALPRLKNGKEALAVFAEKVGIVFEQPKPYRKERLKFYHVAVNAVIDSSGTCRDVKITMADTLHMHAISEFIRSAKFDRRDLPLEVEQWKFYFWTSFRQASKPLARKEYRMEKRRARAEMRRDSINHIYIPLNVAECHKELDKILTPEQRALFADDAFDRMRYDSAWTATLAERWGLYRRSRLWYDFQSWPDEIWHPGLIASRIISSYVSYLRKRG